MRDNMFENKINPFNPEWYQKVFDRYISTHDQSINADDVIKEGFLLPDLDGSRSSQFRREAVLNSSFNEEIVKETLREIYDNSSYKLTASNTDEIGLFKWFGKMSDMEIIPSINKCQLRIPWDRFINQKDRDIYKLSQFYRKWVTIDELMTNWRIFKWDIILFINKRVYSEYEFYFGEQEAIIKFTYNDFWMKWDLPVAIYKYDTLYQHRIHISRELCENQWNWKLPITQIVDQKILNYSKAIVTFNKIQNPDIRGDGITTVDLLGHNIEFLEIIDGHINLSNISRKNKIMILSELSEYLWMRITIPKFMHEFPGLLPVDIVHRSYIANLQKVNIIDRNEEDKDVKIDENEKIQQVYIDSRGGLDTKSESWHYMIRPLVLSDAYLDPFNEPYDSLVDSIRELRDITVRGADVVEEFRIYIRDTVTIQSKLDEYIEKYLEAMYDILERFNQFYTDRSLKLDPIINNIYNVSIANAILDIRENGEESIYFYPKTSSQRNIWDISSDLITRAQELIERYNIIEMIHSIRKRNIYEDPTALVGQFRFQHPIDERDFWLFEYNIDDKVWEPVDLKITRHFPDVYLFEDPQLKDNTLNRIFKAFIFYTDSMNVLEESKEIITPSVDWDKDSLKYYDKPASMYKDIFIEKFYWMGLKAIQSTGLMTSNRWELIENVRNNDSYKRYNDLFLETIDPYFKFGMPTYLKSDHFEFPFDDAIAKLKEAITLNMIDTKKITNFEMYLNNSWIPSYFDYSLKISDDWDWTERHLPRPSPSFDIMKVISILLETQGIVVNASEVILDTCDKVLKGLEKETYFLNVEKIKALRDSVVVIINTIGSTVKMIQELDMDIYCNDDINFIIKSLNNYHEYIEDLKLKIIEVQKDVDLNYIYHSKRALIKQIHALILKLYEEVDATRNNLSIFDIEKFMKAVNDLRSYLDGRKTNSDDRSLIGDINKFDDPWVSKVKQDRNKLFLSTNELYVKFRSDMDTNEAIGELIAATNNTINDMNVLKESLTKFWNDKSLKPNDPLLDHLEYLIDTLIDFLNKLTLYTDSRNLVWINVMAVKNQFDLFDDRISATEITYRDAILNEINKVVLNIARIDKEIDMTALDKSKYIINNNIIKFLDFFHDEEIIFELLLSIVEEPVPYILNIEDKRDILIELIKYMDSVNDFYIPNKNIPTYSDVFEVGDISVHTKGFNYTLNERIFIPIVGSFIVSDIGNELNQVESIQLMEGYRLTSLIDPVYIVKDYPIDHQHPIYYATSDGIGSGLSIKAISSNKIPIINDTIIKNFITRIENIHTNVSKFIHNPNPYNNNEYNIIVNVMNKSIVEWENIINRFSSHISISAKDKMDELINSVKDLKEKSMEFINQRSNIHIESIVKSVDLYITDIYNTLIDNNLYDVGKEYDSNIREKYQNLIKFYGNGSLWNDSTELISILHSISSCIVEYINNVLNSDFPDKTDKISLSIDIKQTIDNTINLLNDIFILTPTLETLLETVINNVNEISDMDLQEDIWYRLGTIVPVVRGVRYETGDIVEVTINYTEPEKLVFQIMKVLNGEVMEIQPLLNYALPYQLNNILDTTTLSGKGFGLKIQLSTLRISIEDSIYLKERNQLDVIKPFQLRDYFLFKFDNIHDLNIGYEVFIGGKQLRFFHIRHKIDNDNPLHPEKIDVVYLDANDVIAVQSSTIHIPAEHYFIHKISGIKIKDPGAGYAKDQTVVVDGGIVAIKLKVSELTKDPFKGIVDFYQDATNISFTGDVSMNDVGFIVPDQLNNIDDEFHISDYDKIPKDGISKPLTYTYPQSMYEFISKRYDKLDGDNRNNKFMYPDIVMSYDIEADNGDPEFHWYQGSRIENSQHPMLSPRRWDGILNLNPPTDTFIPDKLRLPLGKPVKGEYQLIKSVRFHTSNPNSIIGDKIVPDHASIPKMLDDWPDVQPGSILVVQQDETLDNHRVIYRSRSLIPSGEILYNEPEINDLQWNHFEVDWMNIDWHPELPNLVQQYPTAPWKDPKYSYRDIQQEITDGVYNDDRRFAPDIINNTSYIDNLTLDDLSVFNWTTKNWENLQDNDRWSLEVIHDPDNNKYGFRLTFSNLNDYDYEMRLYLNKVPVTQIKNSELKRNASMEISTILVGEVDKPAETISIDTGKMIRIRKLFPFEQKETFILGTDGNTNHGRVINFKPAPSIHFHNKLYLDDVKVYNKTTHSFENIFDVNRFEIRFKDDKVKNIGKEVNRKAISTIISLAGNNFYDGYVWGYNSEYDIHIFGEVTANEIGYIETFTLTHCSKMPNDDIDLDFEIYQTEHQSPLHRALIMIEFATEDKIVYEDGYIHNVTNKWSILPKEIQILVKYDLNDLYEYEVSIIKTHKQYKFTMTETLLTPTVRIYESISANRMYILTDNGRLPVINPSTNKPTIRSRETSYGTDITFTGLFRNMEEIDLRILPYPVRSVYTLRDIPRSGYIDLKGKINKPLSRRYFEFWVNGKLLSDEITIVSPTKLFLHGLKSLKNLEILEIDRDPNEYFSDLFLELKYLDNGRIISFWNYDTYLDKALEGELEDNYSRIEQEHLLSPVWKQVEKDHPSYKDYPPNEDNEPDVLLKVNNTSSIIGGNVNTGTSPDFGNIDISFDGLIIDGPRIEGILLTDNKFTQYGLLPIDDETIVNMYNEEWVQEINDDPYLGEHVVISNNEWYGSVTRLYDEYGIRVHNLDDSAYKVYDHNTLQIDTKGMTAKIYKNEISYDLD